MKLFKSLNRLKSSGRSASRRQSKDLANAAYSHTTTDTSSPLPSKRASVTMLPRDSASSIPTTNPDPTAIHRRLTSRGLYCPKRPGLQEILSGRSERPWTLEAFTSYCEQNLCLENLRFIQEAEDYDRRYQNWVESRQDPPTAADQYISSELVAQWRAMLAHYIAAGGPQEVNLSGDVREALLSVPASTLPADPHLLSNAVNLTHRLIEDSILFPFLNDTRHNCDEEDHIDYAIPPKVEARPKSYAVPLDFRTSRPSSRDAAHGPMLSNNLLASTLFHKRSVPARSDSRPKSVFSNKDSYGSSGTTSIDAAMIDDSTASVTSPSVSHATPRTPPLSPPGSECGRPSPRPRSDSSWRRFGAKFGFAKKRRSNSQLRSVRSEGSVFDD